MKKATQTAATANGKDNKAQGGKNSKKATPASATAATTAKSEGQTSDTPEGGAAAPAATVPSVTKAKKQPPLANGKRNGGGAGSRTSKKTINFAEASYNDITNSIRHIANGQYVPLFNGAPGTEVDATKPAYKSAEEAFAAGEQIEFGIDNSVPKFSGYKQNRHLAEGMKTSKPENLYDCFLTAETKEQAYKAIENINKFYAMPWNKNVKMMVTILPVFKSTTGEAGVEDITNEMYVAPAAPETPVSEEETATV